MIPFYFESCLGWFHPAKGSRGVVICPALGLEELCTHRFLRELAGELAGAGMPTLRFDYEGTGNSAGSDLDPNRVSHWKASIGAAIDWLRAETGVTEVAVVGLRAGALMAAAVAAERGDVARLALLAPPLSGTSYLREMRALSLLLAQGSSSIDVPAADDSVEVEVGGFPVTGETASALRELDVATLTVRPAPHVLLYERALPKAESKASLKLRELGSDVTTTLFTGYAELKWNSSTDSLPDHAFHELTRWLTSDLPAGQSHSPTSFSDELITDEYRERPIQYGTGGALFGVECLPARDSKNHAVLFLNHGANHHVGWARNFVRLARRFAALGVSSFRIDVAGFGDSPAHEGTQENRLYARESRKDARAAVEWLVNEGYERVTVLGHCAGANLGFYTAVEGAPITDLVLVNFVRFFWQPGDSLEIAMRSSFRSTDFYLKESVSLNVWARVLRGDVNLVGICKAMLRRAGQRVSAGIGDVVASTFNTENNGHKVRRWFRDLSRRGVRVLLVYGAEDSALDEIALHAGPRARKLRRLPNLDVRVLDNTDHNITSPHAYELYARTLEEHLGMTHADAVASR